MLKVGSGLSLQIYLLKTVTIVIVARNDINLARTSEELKCYNVHVINIEKDLFNKEAPFEIYDEVKANHLTIHPFTLKHTSNESSSNSRARKSNP